MHNNNADNNHEHGQPKVVDDSIDFDVELKENDITTEETNTNKEEIDDFESNVNEEGDIEMLNYSNSNNSNNNSNNNNSNNNDNNNNDFEIIDNSNDNQNNVIIPNNNQSRFDEFELLLINKSKEILQMRFKQCISQKN